MVVNKPAVIIYTREPDEDLLREICAGIEEEGVPYEVHAREGSMDGLAYEAAGDSMLGTGVGMEGRRISMQMARLPKGKNVFELNHPRFWQCRNLGSNCGRAVKKMPFKPVYTENGEMSL